MICDTDNMQRMNTNGRSRIQIPVRHEASSSKLTPEMCRAIRRQDHNGGFDYWKSGYTGLGDVTSPTIERKPKFPGMSQINVTFPGLFLPNVDGMATRLRRRNSNVTPNSMPLGIRRSNSMISTTPTRRIPIQTIHIPRKSIVNLDLASQPQSPDPSLTYTNATFPDIGHFQASQNRARNVDYSWDDRNFAEAEDATDGYLDNGEDMSKPMPDYPSVISEDFNEYEEFSEVESISSPVILSDSEKPAFPIQNGKPYKSILKSPSSGQSWVSKERFIPQQIKMPSVCSYTLPSSRPGLVPTITLFNSSGKLGSMRPQPHNGYVYNSLRRQQSARASSSQVVPMGYDDQLSEVVNDMTTRKRCVRFSATHQIHEYRPYDPIINC